VSGEIELAALVIAATFAAVLLQIYGARRCGRGIKHGAVFSYVDLLSLHLRLCCMMLEKALKNCVYIVLYLQEVTGYAQQLMLDT
jgi:hypothetical protein